MLFFILLFISSIHGQIIQNPIQLANHQMLTSSVEITVDYISSLEKTVLDSLEMESKEVTDSTEELLESSANKKRIIYLREERLKEVEALKHLARSFSDAARLDLLKVRDYVSWYLELTSMTTQLMTSYRVKMQAVLDQNEVSHELFEKKLERGANAPAEPGSVEQENKEAETIHEENSENGGDGENGEPPIEETTDVGEEVGPEEATPGSQGVSSSTIYGTIKARSTENDEVEGSGDSNESL